MEMASERESAPCKQGGLQDVPASHVIDTAEVVLPKV